MAIDSEIYSLAVSPDGRSLLTGTRSGKIQSWDAGTLRLRYSREQPSLIASLEFSPDSTTFVSAKDGVVQVWEASTGQPLRTLPHPKTLVDKAIFSSDGHRA